MAWIIGPTPETNFTINSGAHVRHHYRWPQSPAGRGTQIAFAIPATIRTQGGRLVSFDHGVEQIGDVVKYTVDVRCEGPGSAGYGGGTPA